MDWQKFLGKWSHDVIRYRAYEDYDHITEEMIDRKWLGYEPASEAEIEALEARLKVTLPPSYKAFLRVSNGWLISHPRLFGCDEVDWHIKLDPDNIDGWSIGFGKNLDELDDDIIERDLGATLQISEARGTEYYLLNPQRLYKSGEWQAWHFAHWIPGVWPFRSFESMMRNQYKFHLDSMKRSHNLYREGDNALKKLPGLEKELREHLKRFRDIPDTLGQFAAEVQILEAGLYKVSEIRTQAKDSDEALTQLRDYLLEVEDKSRQELPKVDVSSAFTHIVTGNVSKMPADLPEMVRIMGIEWERQGYQRLASYIKVWLGDK